MNFLKLKDAANKLLEFMEKYDLNNYNERLVKKFLNELIYVIDTDDIKKMEFNDSIFYYIKIID